MPALHAQQPFRFFASVVDRSGAPVSGMTADDFKVTESGIDCKVLNVEPIDWPVRVEIMVDNGIGMEQSLVPIRNGLKGLLQALPDGIEIALLTTAPQPRFVRRPTTDRQALLEGVDRIAPDRGAQRFVEALNEAAARLDQERGNYFPVVIILGSTNAEGSTVRERDLRRMFERFTDRAATVHVVMLSNSGANTLANSSLGTGTGGANQIFVGMEVSKATGGRYDNLSAATRIATLLPEIGAQVAKSHGLQSRQYRITVQRPNRASGPPAGLIVATRPGQTISLTVDGHLP
jgi:hypothetical protein